MKMIELTKENKDKYKYICEKCNLGTNALSIYNRHLESVMHKGNRDTRCDKIRLDKCPHCDYEMKSNLGLKSHILNNHGTKEERKEGFKFYCELCDVGVFAKAYFKMHSESKKHTDKVKEQELKEQELKEQELKEQELKEQELKKAKKDKKNKMK